MTRLFHFSDRSDIGLFTPRPVRVAAQRRSGQEWLNGPLVWAIDEWHEPLYLFPRECPRILIWPTARSSEDDRRRWIGDGSVRMIAFVEEAWLQQLGSAHAHRYTMPVSSFVSLNDAGMWVSREAVTPSRMDTLADLPNELAARDVELRVYASLLPLKELWQTTLHASGIRLRNVQGWGEPGWPHSEDAR